MKIVEELSKKIKLTETEKEILEYMVENLDVLPKLSSRKLAEKTYTSPTTIVRFVKKLGYQNYNDFKYNIISKLKNNNEESQITSHEKALSVLNKVEKIQIEAMGTLFIKILRIFVVLVVLFSGAMGYVISEKTLAAWWIPVGVALAAGMLYII